MTKVIVVGAGVVGASVAFHLAERGAETVILDRMSPASGPTARSAGLVRAHYPTSLEGNLAWESITDYFEDWGERVGGGCGFTRTGFSYLASETDAAKVEANTRMLREEAGVETHLVGAEDLEEIDPEISAAGVAAAAYEPRGGYADPAATTLSLLNAAKRSGATFQKREVTGLSESGGRITGVRTNEGSLEADLVILCAASWSASLARGVGLYLPIRPARVQVVLLQRPFGLPTHLTFIDSVNEISCRPTSDHCTFVSMRLVEMEWLEDADDYSSEASEEFVATARERLPRRIPAMKDARPRLGWSGVLDMTPDGRPIMGPAGPEGLHLCTGWSGKGFKKAPAVGAEVARWALDGSPKRPDLESYRASRFDEGQLVHGKCEYGVSSPH